MNNTTLGYALLLAIALGSTGCGDSPQQSSTPQPPAAPAPAQQSDTPTPQSTMEVRQPESSAPTLPAPHTAMPSTPPATTPSSPAAQATPAAPAPATTASKPAAPAKGTVLKTSELKAQPFIDASTVATLQAQTAVTILERNGGWFRVQSAAQSGWVRMLNIKVTEGAQNLGSGSDLTQAATLATGRAGSGNIVSTSGLRGLSEEQLRTAKPDYAQFDQLDSYGVDKAAATSYAKANGLTSRSVHYLSAPK